jgi:hypothetical protein
MGTYAFLTAAKDTMSTSELNIELEHLRECVAELERREQESAEREAGLRRDLAQFQLVIDHLPMRVFWKEAKDLHGRGMYNRLSVRLVGRSGAGKKLAKVVGRWSAQART